MTLKEIKDYFKSEYGWTEGISIGKIDNNLDKAICFYNHGQMPKVPTVGGKKNKKHGVKSVNILLSWTSNADEAEKKAHEIYAFFDEKEFILNDKRVFVISQYEYPIGLGTDDRGIYEFSLIFDFYYEI